LLCILYKEIVTLSLLRVIRKEKNFYAITYCTIINVENIDQIICYQLTYLKSHYKKKAQKLTIINTAVILGLVLSFSLCPSENKTQTAAKNSQQLVLYS
jgi:hypothetical protein